jgi:hypothetical protein
MTDPERISKRGAGLAAQLLRAGADEQPGDAGVQQTLAALGVAGAVLTSSSAAGAAAGAKLSSVVSAGAATGAAANVVSATLLAKWIGIGVVGGIGLAGAAAVATGPGTPAPAVAKATNLEPRVAHQRVSSAAVAPAPREVPGSPVAESPVAESPTATPALRASVVSPREPTPELDVGAPLAEEVAYVDRARALLRSGRAEQGLALLARYERQFPEARLLPEVLFLQLEACERSGRASEARGAARRLVEGFPKSPHATRARTLLEK